MVCGHCTKFVQFALTCNSHSSCEPQQPVSAQAIPDTARTRFAHYLSRTCTALVMVWVY